MDGGRRDEGTQAEPTQNTRNPGTTRIVARTRQVVTGSESGAKSGSPTDAVPHVCHVSTACGQPALAADKSRYAGALSLCGATRQWEHRETEHHAAFARFPPPLELSNHVSGLDHTISSEE
ncbi:hypothetical protein JX265_003918 [Neoarthrinium moseri]|uniref:Uncharacterized protein n=1 Tax=Neoarthrinium moseri TaxID=1658444 RepID=A0A9P9WRN9_9PEZI|nr:uncharacterized protein JN550_009482 [Neoarthrinium moseri]KAI1853749.1 hypothetical protein JX266_001733 [Neoarthrinium moseri]KAI1863782.1 hypothetical protein JN550_009482 [Neoarthrinium moseri]KAI1876392.1 hypothetical protein JX265_003918 [Neoarthrinium moseri]